MAEKETVMLIIMDGFGCSDIKEYNAVAQADLKVLPELWRTYPHSYLEASAEFRSRSFKYRRRTDRVSVTYKNHEGYRSGGIFC